MTTDQAPSPVQPRPLRLDVDLWSDFSCVWCWLAKHRFETAVQRSGHDVDLRIHSFLIDPDGPRESIPSLENLASKAGVSLLEARAMEEGMKRDAEAEGIPYAVERHHSDGFDAHRVFHLAREYDQGEAFFADLQIALFAAGADIYDAGHLTEAAVARGVPRDAVVALLNGTGHADSVRHDLDEARRRGVAAVPHMVINDRLVIPGATSVESYVSVIARAAAADA
jgi:predicted DsbA family dithiol-disulfide isomerase